MTLPKTDEQNEVASRQASSELRQGLQEVVAHLVREVRDEIHEIGGKLSGSDENRLSGMSSDELSQVRTGMAIQRTLMGADRTLMAWVRTSLAMSSFGFTLYKVLQGFQQSGTLLPTSDTPREVGLFLIGLGTIAMVMGIVDYWLVLRELRLLKHIRLRRPALTMAVLMAAFGIVLFISVIAKVL